MRITKDFALEFSFIHASLFRGDTPQLDLHFKSGLLSFGKLGYLKIYRFFKSELSVGQPHTDLA